MNPKLVQIPAGVLIWSDASESRVHEARRGKLNPSRGLAGLGCWKNNFHGADGAAPSRVAFKGVIKCNDLVIKAGKLRKYLYLCISLNLKSRDY